MTNPVSTQGFAHMYMATLENSDGRNIIISLIGAPNLPSFEIWAFNCPNVQYDESARFLWNIKHRTTPLISPLKQAFKTMAELWKIEFTTKKDL